MRKLRFGAVILAAGTASRMGQQKLLLPLAGKPLLAHILGTIGAFEWADCIAVIGEPESELAELCRQYQVCPVFNPDRQRGQASSIVLAVKQLALNLHGIMFFLGDQPLVSGELIAAIVARFQQLASNEAIVVPCYRQQSYSPVLFSGFWRSSLEKLEGDTGGRQIIRQHPEWVSKLDWPEPEPFYDADTWEEYQRLKQRVK